MHRVAPAIAIGLVAVANLLTAGPLHADTLTTTSVGADTTTAATTTTTSAPPPTTTTTTTTPSPTPTTTVARHARRVPALPHPAAEPRAGNDLAVTISSTCTSTTFCFAPQQLTVVAGDTVTWVNRTGVEHTVVRCMPAACNGVSGGSATSSFAPGTVGAAQGAAFSHTFTEPGTYVYYCTIHGYAGMHGTITVSPAATATTAAPTTAPPTAAAPATPTTPAGPRLAHTGSNTSAAFALAVILTGAGLFVSSFARRRRHL